jgi:hypothetical protein
LGGGGIPVSPCTLICRRSISPDVITLVALAKSTSYEYCRVILLVLLLHPQRTHISPPLHDTLLKYPKCRFENVGLTSHKQMLLLLHSQYGSTQKGHHQAINVEGANNDRSN